MMVIYILNILFYPKPILWVEPDVIRNVILNQLVSEEKHQSIPQEILQVR